MENLQPYSDYVDSGYAWLGTIPSHWTLRRAKLLYREVDERSETGTETLCSVSHKTGVTLRKANVTMFMAESTVGYKVCRPDDLAINTLWAWMAALGVARQVGIVSPAYGVYRPRPGSPLVSEYADRLLRTEQYKQEYIARSTGVNASRLRLYPEQFLQIPILLPPPDEQSAIVRFLGAMDWRVNRLVLAKRRLIELLTEQKQALITHTVTRGLNPNSKLKPSGMYWLRDLPASWEARKLRFSVDSVGGMTPSKADESFWNGDVPWVSPKDMKFIEIVDAIDHITQKALRETNIALVPPPAVLIVVRGMILARTFPVAVTKVPITINQDMKALRPRSDVSAPYLRHLLSGLGDVVMSLIEESGHGTRVLRTDLWRDLILPLPPLAEQRAICKYIDEQTAQFEKVIGDARREVELILEYRTRLVADVVTGKLDVRGVASKLWKDDGAAAESLEAIENDTTDTADECAEEVSVAEAAE